MTSRTRFCAPKPIASPAMPAPVMIGTMSIDSSRSTIKAATNATETVTRLVRIPPSVAARRSHSRSPVACRRASLNCICSIARFAARMTMNAPATMMMRLMPCVRNQCPNSRGSNRGSFTPSRSSASEMLASAATPYARSVSARINCRARV